MSRPNLIPDSLINAILKKSRNGDNAQTIANWLEAEHGIKCEDRIVQRRLKEFRRIEQEARKDVIREAATNDAINCVEIINNHITLMSRITDEMLNSDDNDKRVIGRQIADTLLKYIDKKMNLSGMDQSDTYETNEIMEGLLAKIGRINE